MCVYFNMSMLGFGGNTPACLRASPGLPRLVSVSLWRREQTGKSGSCALLPLHPALTREVILTTALTPRGCQRLDTRPGSRPLLWGRGRGGGAYNGTTAGGQLPGGHLPLQLPPGLSRSRANPFAYVAIFTLIHVEINPGD